MLTTPDLEAFFHALATVNPFDANRVVVGPHAWVDAETVFARPFAEIVEHIEAAQRDRGALGVLLFGEAGSGKSHLLERLERHFQAEPPSALFLKLANLQAAPESMPRALLRGVMALMTAGRHGRGAPLFRVINGLLRHAIGGVGARAYAPSEVERATERLVSALCREAPGVTDAAVFHVFFRFFCAASLPGQGAGAEAALRWLRGELIENDEARLLDLASGGDEGVGLRDDEQVKAVLVALAHAAYYWGRPMVLVLDQVDNLDPPQFAALARFLHALLDAAGNLVVLCAGVRDTLVRWKETKIVQESSWHRLAQREVELQRLPVAEALPVVESRLQRFLAPFDGIDEVARQQGRDALFPLGLAWYENYGKDHVEVRPRDLMNAARGGWAAQQRALHERGGLVWLRDWPAHGNDPVSPEQPQETLENALAARLDALTAEQGRLLQRRGWDPEGMADVLKTLCACCQAREQWPYLKSVTRLNADGRQRTTLHIMLEHRISATGPDVRRGVACLVGTSGNALTFQLERLKDLDEPPDELLLLHEGRSALAPGEVGREHLDELRRLHEPNLHIVALGHDEQAALYGMHALLSEASEFEAPGSDGSPRSLSREEIVDALLESGRLLKSPALRLLLKMEPAEALTT